MNVSPTKLPADAGLAQLNASWQTRAGASEQPLAVAEYTAFAERALGLAEPFIAYDVCSEGLSRHPHSIRLRQLLGLALARSGAAPKAVEVLRALYDEGHRDEETVAMLARAHKDLWQQRGAAAADHLRRARALYDEAFAASNGYWSGINAAVLALAEHDASAARALAEAVRGRCSAPADGDYWRLATLAEASLVLGEDERAEDGYRRALACRTGLGNLATTRRQAELIVDLRQASAPWLHDVFPRPQVVVFSGHRPDLPGRPQPRFPAMSAARVKDAIGAYLDRSGARIGFASAASGGDILFHEAIVDRGGESHVVLADRVDDFAAGSVAGHPGGDWEARFARVLERAASVTVVAESIDPQTAFLYSNWITLGMARIRARHVGGDTAALALWDGKPGLPGGTAAAVADWRAFGQPIDCIEPASGELRRVDGDRSAPGAWHGALPTGAGYRIVSILFADAVGFSKLKDEQIKVFSTHFLGGAAKLLADMEPAPITRNTWGDALYLCFLDPRAAGIYALRLRDFIATTQWAALGLPADFSVRIALHCGPAMEIADPVSGQANFIGAHVSRAARIEPVTPPGQVYASQPFAALAECLRVSEFSCDYVGQLPLAKSFGTFPTFVVQSRR